MIRQIFILSDGTGRTAELAVKAALTQFEGIEYELNIRADIRTEAQVTAVVKEAQIADGFIIHTAVAKNLRDIILNQGRLYDIETIDLMGPLLAQLSNQLNYLPSEKPGLFHDLNRAYFQRIEALEFAFRHDDGQKTEELAKADIVLLGVSRTFKTPVTIYLAFKGWLVANVPLIQGIEPPEILHRLPPERVFGLTTEPNRLAELRSVREKHFGGATGDYAKLDYVQRELSYAYQLFKEHSGWAVIDVSNKPIEEIASEILMIIRKRAQKELKGD